MYSSKVIHEFLISDLTSSGASGEGSEMSISWYYNGQLFTRALKAAVYASLIDADGSIKEDLRYKCDGKHIVIPIEGENSGTKVYLKYYPELLGHHFFGQLVQSIFLRKKVESLVCKIHDKYNLVNHPLLLTVEVPGETLKQRVVNDGSEDITDCLDKENFTLKLISTLLVSPADESRSNLVLMKSPESEKHTLWSVDDDLILARPFYSHRKSRSFRSNLVPSARRIIRIKSAVFCMKMMAESPSLSALYYFINLDLNEVFVFLTRELFEYQLTVMKLFHAMPIIQDEGALEKRCFLQPRFLSEALNRFIYKLLSLRNFVAKTGRINSHFELMEVAEPAVAPFYRELSKIAELSMRLSCAFGETKRYRNVEVTAISSTQKPRKVPRDREGTEFSTDYFDNLFLYIGLGRLSFFHHATEVYRLHMKRSLATLRNSHVLLFSHPHDPAFMKHDHAICEGKTMEKHSLEM